MLFFIFWPLPEKLLDCPKKNYFARLWGAAAEWGDLQGRGNHFEMKSLGNNY